MPGTDAFAGSVQRNCDIADARHARDAGLCTYLLQMRELYRWRHRLPLDEQPAKDALSDWLVEHETGWNELEEASFEPLHHAGTAHDPFDAPGLNAKLLDENLVYGAGIGRFHRPHFFLARLEHREVRDGLQVLIAGEELARDIVAFPGALQGHTIIVRQDVLRRSLWEHIAFWKSHRAEGALAQALDAWRIDEAAQFDRVLAARTEEVVLHELGEAHAASLLGPAWEAMLLALEDRRAELVARAVRDNLADCLSTLPALLERAEAASIHYYFARLDGLQRELFPALTGAYQAWCAAQALAPLERIVRHGALHWERAARRMLDGEPVASSEAFAL